MRKSLLLAAVVAAAWGADPERDLLVSTAWLAARLKDDSLVLLNVGSKADYDAGHIPGARLVTLADISVTGPRGLRLELPPVEMLRETFARLGISDGSRIVVYPGTDSVQSATRVWFTLEYLGLGERSSLLDGGLKLWRAEGRPVSMEAPPARQGRITAQPRPELVVDAAWLDGRLAAGGVTVVDARAPEFYRGSNSGGMPRAGHIPGAVNIPFSTLLDRDLKFAREQSLRAALGTAGKPLVAYCHIGQQATVVYFAARLLGLEARLYDGSFQDWSSRPELRVEEVGKSE